MDTQEKEWCGGFKNGNNEPIIIITTTGRSIKNWILEK